MAVTRRDVARLANVSEATVSFVMNNTKKVSPDVHKRVLDAAKTLNYHPSLLAKSMVTKETKHVAMLVDNIQNPHYGRLLKGVQQVAESEGYIVSMISTNYSTKSAMTELISRGVDGVILALGSYTVGDFSGLNLPMVYAGDILSVSYRSAIFDMVSAFHDCGHKRIAFLSGLRMSSPSHIRYQNFKEALTYYHMDSDEALFVDGDGYTDEESGYAAADRLLSRGVEFTGLFAVNDLMAMGAMKRLWEAGLSIPGDVSLAGCDGIKSSAYTIPPLSTIQCHSFTIGSCLMYELLFKLHPERYASCTGKVIEAEFVRRESLGRAAN